MKNTKRLHTSVIHSMLYARYDITDLLSSHHLVKHNHKTIEKHSKELMEKVKL